LVSIIAVPSLKAKRQQGHRLFFFFSTRLRACCGAIVAPVHKF
jgi:hypothetical protein